MRVKQKTSREGKHIRKEMDASARSMFRRQMWGARANVAEHFSIGKDLMPREMITAYATLKKAAANGKSCGKRLDIESIT